METTTLPSCQCCGKKFAALPDRDRCAFSPERGWYCSECTEKHRLTPIAFVIPARAKKVGR